MRASPLKMINVQVRHTITTWARELYLEKKLLLNHIRDEDMMADSLSKVTDRAKFLKCRAALLNLSHG